MAKKRKRTTMRNVREILRLHYESGLSNRQIADALRISKTSVFNIVGRFNESGIVWPVPEDLSETELEARIYRKESSKKKADILPDFEYINEELARPHMTLELLWNEYAQDNPEGLGRSSFYRHYRKYRKSRSISMKVIHKGGDKVFVDYSGDQWGQWGQWGQIFTIDKSKKSVQAQACKLP